MANSLASLTEFYQQRIATHPVLVATAVGLVPALAYGVRSYRGYIDLGPGGLPYNVVGWLIQALLQSLARQDVLSTSVFAPDPKLDAHYGPAGRKSYLPSGPGSLPKREGTRPVVPGYVAPQRQITEGASPEMKVRMDAELDALVAANAALLATRPSALEGRGTMAAWLREEGQEKGDLPAILKGVKGEITHVHPEGSSHVTLSLVDAEEAIQKGWAIGSKLSGILGGRIPLTYVLIYAPRNEAEFAVWKTLITAGCSFVCEGRGTIAK